MELVSIIIPAYNSEAWIKETILSAINQSWKKKEVIIIDDGSTDNTFEVANTFRSGQVKVLRQDNRGACAARNEALNVAQGEYIQWLDSDDLLAPEKIENQLRYRQGSWERTSLLSSAFSTFFYTYWQCHTQSNSLCITLDPIEWLLNKLLNDDFLFPATWLVTRRLTDAAGKWDESLSLNDDGEYFGRVVSISSRVVFVKDSMCFYRQANRQSLSRRRDPNAYKSLLRSYVLLIGYILHLENSERTRSAAIRYLQSNYVYFYDGPEDTKNTINDLANSLGGKLHRPKIGGKFISLERVFGYQITKNLADYLRTDKEKGLSLIDKMIARIPV